MSKKNKRGQGEGSIRKRKDGTYEARYTIGIGPDGKQIQKSIYSKDSEDIKQRLRKILTSIDEGTYIEPKKITVRQWLDTWFKEYKIPTVKPNTLACYENIINKHINPVIGNVLLRDLRADHIQRLYNTVAKAYSKRMVELTHITIHNALEQAIKSDLLIRNVSELVDLPKGKDEREGTADNPPRVLTVEEQQALLKALKGERLEAAFYLMIFTGLRRGELLGLKWSDIDMNEKILHVNRLLCRFKNYDEEIEEKTRLDFASLKTVKSKRDIPLLDELIPILKAHKAMQKVERVHAADSYIKNDLVVCNEIGEAVDPRMLKKQFDKILEKAGLAKLKMPNDWKPGKPLPDDFEFPKWYKAPEGWEPGKSLPTEFKPPEGVNIHALRHTFATRGLENGIELKVMQELLGHSTIVLTGDTYSHVLPNKKREAIDKLKGTIKAAT
jgi:Site-specific recombinase XerD